MSFSFLRCSVAALAVSIPSLSYAAGSLPLQDIVPVIAQSPVLSKQLQRVLANTGLSISSITCMGVRIGNNIEALGGSRIGPFSCQFGSDTTLTIETETMVMLGDGKIVQIAEILPMNPQPTEAYLVHRLVKWNWK